MSNLILKWESDLAEARSKFMFESAKDSRLATPDYAKHKAAFTAFNIAEQIIKAAKATGMVIEVESEKLKCPRCGSEGDKFFSWSGECLVCEDSK